VSRAQQLYQSLRSIADTSVDRALAAALPTADAQSRQWIALILLERQHAGSLTALVVNYHLLEEPTRVALIGQIEHLYSPMRVASESRDEQVRTNVIEIVRRARHSRLAYLVTDQLRHMPREVRQAAADCLLELAQGHARSDQVNSADARSVAYLAKAIFQAVRSFDVHGQKEMLHALTLVSPMPLDETRELLVDAEHPATSALARLMEDAEAPATRRALLAYAKVPTLVDAALIGIGNAWRHGHCADVLHTAHLTIDGSVRELLLSLKQPILLLPRVDQLPEALAASGKPSNLQQWRHLPQWIMALPIEASQKVQKLAALEQVPDAPTRLAALRRLMQLSEDSQTLCACAVIADFCHDPHTPLARIAIRFLVRRKWEGLMPLLLKLVNGSDQQIRVLAAAQLAPLGFNRLWAAWPRLSSANQIAAGRALIKLDRGFHSHLGARLKANDDNATKMQALAIIQRLRQGQFFVPTLEAMIHDQDVRIASSAVQVLGAGECAEAADQLRKALDHHDSRVRANAVEALHQLHLTEPLPQLLRMARHDEARPRANAIGVLIETQGDQAIELLLNMLADKRPQQRISALWLIDYLELVQVSQQVAELSIADRDPSVRRRAASVIQHLIGSLQAGEGLTPAMVET
jgi:HEAT repeat protein